MNISKMNKTINVNGDTLRIVEYTNPLFRGNAKTSSYTTANKHYGNTYNKFFTTIKEETIPYIKNELKGYIKTWVPMEPLRLLHIFDLETRHSLNKLVNKTLLNTAFPVVRNKVYRYSEEDTAQIDAKLLSELCTIQDNDGNKIDGYIIEKQTDYTTANNGRNIVKFHSEIGLCKSALKKLQLEKNSVNERRYGTIRANKTKRRGSFNESFLLPNNNKYASPPKKSKVTLKSNIRNLKPVRKALFANNSNNNNKNGKKNNFTNLNF